MVGGERSKLGLLRGFEGGVCVGFKGVWVGVKNAPEQRLEGL
jgi:hypothetical protein